MFKKVVGVVLSVCLLLLVFNVVISKSYARAKKTSKNTTPAASLPYWITDTYQYHRQPVFVTFTYKHPYDKNKSQSDAILNIASQAIIYKNAKLKFQYIDSDNYLFREKELFSEYFDYSYDTNDIVSVIDNVEILDSYEMDNGYFYLGYVNNLAIDYNYDLSISDNLSWVSNIYINEGYVVGVGQYPYYKMRSLVQLMESADHAAFLQILPQTELENKSAYSDEQIDTSGFSYQNNSGMIYQKSLINVKNLHVIGRYIDFENNMIYSLAILPENNVFPEDE